MKKLFKKKDGKKICGVCNGLAEYFNLDVTLIRIIWVFLAFFAGIGLIAYLLCAIIMPEKSVNDNVNDFKSDDQNNNNKF